MVERFIDKLLYGQPSYGEADQKMRGISEQLFPYISKADDFQSLSDRIGLLSTDGYRYITIKQFQGHDLAQFLQLGKDKFGENVIHWDLPLGLHLSQNQISLMIKPESMVTTEQRARDLSNELIRRNMLHELHVSYLKYLSAPNTLGFRLAVLSIRETILKSNQDLYSFEDWVPQGQVVQIAAPLGNRGTFIAHPQELELECDEDQEDDEVNTVEVNPHSYIDYMPRARLRYVVGEEYIDEGGEKIQFAELMQYSRVQILEKGMGYTPPRKRVFLDAPVFKFKPI